MTKNKNVLMCAIISAFILTSGLILIVSATWMENYDKEQGQRGWVDAWVKGNLIGTVFYDCKHTHDGDANPGYTIEMDPDYVPGNGKDRQYEAYTRNKGYIYDNGNLVEIVYAYAVISC